jgi:hypothetical protein
LSDLDGRPPLVLANVPGLHLPPGRLPDALATACAEYQRIRAEHGERLQHLRGAYERSLAARQADVTELQKARRGGKQASPHHERDEMADRDRCLLELERLRQQAEQADATVRAVATECAQDYRRQLSEAAEKARGAVLAAIDEIGAQVTSLRTTQACEQWPSQVVAVPYSPIKPVSPDVSGIDSVLAPVAALLAEPGAPDLRHYLNNLRPGDRASTFTVDPGQVSTPR